MLCFVFPPFLLSIFLAGGLVGYCSIMHEKEESVIIRRALVPVFVFSSVLVLVHVLLVFVVNSS